MSILPKVNLSNYDYSIVATSSANKHNCCGEFQRGYVGADEASDTIVASGHF